MKIGTDFKIFKYSTTFKTIHPSIHPSWSRTLLEKLTLIQLVKKFLAFHGGRRFIAAFIRTRNWNLI
jgi:hypothetical protein